MCGGNGTDALIVSIVDHINEFAGPILDIGQP